MTKEGSTKIIHFLISGAGVLVPGCGHISHITSENALFLYKFSSLLPGIDQTNYVHVYSNDNQGRINLNCKYDTQGIGSCARVFRGGEEDIRGMVKIMCNNCDDVHIDCYCINRLNIAAFLCH